MSEEIGRKKGSSNPNADLVDREHNGRNKNKGKRIDLGLEIARLHAKAGRPMTCIEIAAFCGCSPQMIQKVQSEAMRKLRRWYSSEAMAEDVKDFMGHL